MERGKLGPAFGAAAIRREQSGGDWNNTIAFAIRAGPPHSINARIFCAVWRGGGCYAVSR